MLDEYELKPKEEQPFNMELELKKLKGLRTSNINLKEAYDFAMDAFKKRKQTIN